MKSVFLLAAASCVLFASGETTVTEATIGGVARLQVTGALDDNNEAVGGVASTELRTMYLFTNDAPAEPTVGVCPQPTFGGATWPLVYESDLALNGVPADVCKAFAKDGSDADYVCCLTEQYGWMPMYQFTGDSSGTTAAGDTAGGVWFSVAADKSTTAPVPATPTTITEATIDGVARLQVTGALDDNNEAVGGVASTELRTMYLFTNDAPAEPTVGVCPQPTFGGATWPLVYESDLALNGVPADVCKAFAKDGSDADYVCCLTEQYGWMPMYQFTGDSSGTTAAGDTAGGVWFTVAADKSTTAPAPDTPTTITEATIDGVARLQVTGALDDNNEAVGGVASTELRTMYLFTNDAPAEPTVGVCPQPTFGGATWPLVYESDLALDGVPADVCKAFAKDGSDADYVCCLTEQYGWMPMYQFTGDSSGTTAAGDTAGGVWFTVAADKSTTAPAPDTPTTITEATIDGVARLQVTGALDDNNEAVGGVASKELRTMYLFTNDAPAEPTVGVCPQPTFGGETWPLVYESDLALDGVPADVCKAFAKDGSDADYVCCLTEQYGWMPMYQFTGDSSGTTAAGDTAGGVWFTVAADKSTTAPAPEKDGAASLGVSAMLSAALVGALARHA